uniref:AN1-type domain-containing protein n=1 Tax=Globisporangium ultimum (strain ATCC 200006 / CBS 805.95 / DAOM BR144) TaxID=431595 RepID=K3WTA0_GLOUD
MDIGAHCSVGACNQVDFLPFTCDCCKSVFCLHHRTYDAHECPLAGSKDRRVITCPLCSASLHWTLEQDVNIVWEDHVRGGNCSGSGGNQTLGGTNAAGAPKKKKKPRCAAAQCREILTASNQFSCTKCRQNVCMKHRFESDHDCENVRIQLRQQQQQSWSLAGFTRTQNNSNTTANRRSSSAAPSTAKLQQNARQAATSVVKGTKSAVNSLVQNAKTAAASASAASANLITTNSEECPICQKKFAYVSQLIAHVNNAHPENGAAASSRQSALSSASRPIDLTSSPPSAGSEGREVCPQCHAVFSDVAALIHHAETAHAATVAASASGASSSSGGQEKCNIS